MSDLDCREVLENLYLVLDGELPLERLEELKGHVARCAPCFGYYGIEWEFKAIVRRSCAARKLDPAVLDRIRLALRREPPAP